MRRLLAILLLAAFGLPTAAPLLAQGQDLERNLPACCRRNGTHHCAMGAPQSTNAPTVTTRCPSFPEQAAAATLTPAALLATTPTTRLPDTTQSTPTRTESQPRTEATDTHQTRGPPSDTSL